MIASLQDIPYAERKLLRSYEHARYVMLGVAGASRSRCIVPCPDCVEYEGICEECNGVGRRQAYWDETNRIVSSMCPVCHWKPGNKACDKCLGSGTISRWYTEQEFERRERERNVEKANSQLTIVEEVPVDKPNGAEESVGVLYGSQSDENEGSHVGRLRVSSDMLRKLLRLPSNVKFRNFRSADVATEAGFDMECIVESEDLPLVPPAQVIPPVTVNYRQERLEDVDVYLTKFDGWGH